MKKSFILHVDSLDVIDAMTDEQCWKLLKKMRSYNGGAEYNTGDHLVDVVFIQFRNQFDRDTNAYNSVCERNKNNWSKGGRPRTQPNPKNPVGFWETQHNPTEPKKPDNDSDSVNDSDSDSDSENDIKVVSNDTTPDGVLENPPDPEIVEDPKPLDPKKKVPPKKEKSSAKKEKKVTVVEWEGGELVYGNPEVNDILEKIENYCTLYGVVYAPAPNERNAAQWLLSDKFNKHAQRFNMTREKFIENIIKIWAKLEYGKWAYNAPSIYYNRGEIVDKGRKARLKKAEEANKAQSKVKPWIRTS